MKSRLPKYKEMAFRAIAFSLVFVILNAFAWVVNPSDSVFWQNPLMVIYPVDKFDPRATQTYNFNKDPNRAVRYVPDPHRWYRLDPEPTIPDDGTLILHFGDSSTWGWGLRDRGDAYPIALERLLPSSVHSINLGIPGYSSIQGLRYMEEFIPRYHTRILAITIYFGNNDSTENGSSDAEKLMEESAWTQGLRHIPLFRLTHDSVIRIMRNRNRAPRVSPGEYRDNLTRMVALARAYEIRVILIEPPRHLSYPPAHLTYTKSLRSAVRNPWTRDELDVALQSYSDGLKDLYRGRNEYESVLVNALDHDWVVPRIKSAWLRELRGIAEHEKRDVAYIPATPTWILAEEYEFEDYCHPSRHLHAQIANKIRSVLAHDL